MKKALFIVLLLASRIIAEDLNIGLGPYFQTQPYKGASTLIVPSPVVFYDNGIIYARWTRVGVYFYGKKSEDVSWGFSLTAQPRPNGYKPSNSDALKDLDEKKTSIEGGLAFTIYGSGKYLEAILVTDMLDRYNSYIAKVETGFKYEIAHFTFYPSIIFIYESKDFTDYYYGISQKEAQRSHPAGEPSAGYSGAGQ